MRTTMVLTCPRFLPFVGDYRVTRRPDSCMFSRSPSDGTTLHTTTPADVVDGVGCHRLIRSYNGVGQDPLSAMDYSEDCNVGEYVADEVVTVTADPAWGWRVASWLGADDDDSTATTNTVTMPDEDHAVSVTYELRDDLSSIYLPLVGR